VDECRQHSLTNHQSLELVYFPKGGRLPDGKAGCLTPIGIKVRFVESGVIMSEEGTEFARLSQEAAEADKAAASAR
jgi:hypothetical protein